LAEREVYDELPSTQDRAIALARSGADEGTVVRAARQTRGRGRLDHRWASPSGGLWMSVILPSPPSRGSWLSLAVGVRVLRALEPGGSAPLRLKWPNDVVAVGPDGRVRKLAGILIDRVASPTLGTAAVAGIGVNVRVEATDLPLELRDRVTSLHRGASSPPSVEELEPRVAAAALGAAHALAVEREAATLIAECRSSLFGIGRPVRIDGTPRGTISGLAEDGALLLADGPNVVSIRAGDVDVDGPT
jgi:BirA family transcriptional regulator, biotin operon repressor / biotin---[acetyl-CoA-carboxylase] ligase